jgi:D-3-phosphoglycerate dehydrogenase
MSDVIRVAVTSRSFSRHPILRHELLQRFPGAFFNDDGISLKGDGLIDFLKGAERAVVALEILDAAVFDRLPDLKVIAKYGVGLDTLDLAAMARRGIALGWTGGVNRRSVAELVIAFAIALLRNIPLANRELVAGQWRQPIGRQLSERSVGIIGCGHVGKDLAKLLRAFGCRVFAHDIRDFPEYYAEHGITPVGLDDLLADADIVTLHVPLDATTENLLDADRLAQMKPDGLLINTARGGLVDETAVKKMLMNGLLGGAAFDVFACEPPEDPQLLALPNVLATPHIGGSSAEAILAMGRAAIRGLDAAQLPTTDMEAFQ